MLSPVIVGVRHSVAMRLGWAPPAKVGWKDIAAAAAKGDFRFAMTSPTASNSGFQRTGRCRNRARGGERCPRTTIDPDGLKGFFADNTDFRLECGYLADASWSDRTTRRHRQLRERPHRAERERRAARAARPRLSRGRHHHGRLPAPAPDRGQAEPYEDLVRYLRRADVQDEITEETARRPSLQGITLDDRFGKGLLVEAPFPANLDIVRTLLDEFHTELRKPAHTFYVLDTSGSMDGEPIARLKKAMTGLAGLDRSPSGHFTRFAPREKVTVILATTEANDTKEFEIDSTDAKSTALKSLRAHIDGLDADGNTVLYTSLLRAYELAGQALRNDPGFTTSVVVLTDGNNTAGISYRTFLRLLGNQAPEVRTIPAYTVLIGEPETNELRGPGRANRG